MPIPRLVVGCLLALLITENAASDDTLDLLMNRAAQAIDSGDSARAVAQLDMAIEQQPKYAAAYYLRGREHFRLGQIKESATDFDRYVELKPEVESRQWERGITDYYAGDYEKGAKQFALYQTYHNNDVENAVWRYLCMSAAGGNSKQAVAKARAELLPIENDRRVPMMQIYAMYRGKMTPAEVMSAATEGELSERQKNAQLFYAHLYLGLYFAANGDSEREKLHIIEAEKHKIEHYMWDVARVHALRWKTADK